jgi:hypothetical protein
MRFGTNLSFVPGVVSTLAGTLMIHACQVEILIILVTVAQLDICARTCGNNVVPFAFRVNLTF